MNCIICKECETVQQCMNKGCIPLTSQQSQKTPHPCAELIKAWADGATIQQFHIYPAKKWRDTGNPSWAYPKDKYRIKPEPKSDVVTYAAVSVHHPEHRPVILASANHPWKSDNKNVLTSNVKLTYDGETGALKAVELLS